MSELTSPPAVALQALQNPCSSGLDYPGLQAPHPVTVFPTGAPGSGVRTPRMGNRASQVFGAAGAGKPGCGAPLLAAAEARRGCCWVTQGQGR